MCGLLWLSNQYHYCQSTYSYSIRPNYNRANKSYVRPATRFRFLLLVRDTSCPQNRITHFERNCPSCAPEPVIYVTDDCGGSGGGNGAGAHEPDTSVVVDVVVISVVDHRDGRDRSVSWSETRDTFAHCTGFQVLNA